MFGKENSLHPGAASDSRKSAIDTSSLGLQGIAGH